MNLKKQIKILGLAAFIILTGCGRVNSNDEDKDLIGYKLEYEFLEADGVKSYRINDKEYPFVKRVSGRSENAEYDSYYVVLTSDANLSFKDVDSQFWGSNLSSNSGFVIVEYGLIKE